MSAKILSGALFALCINFFQYGELNFAVFKAKHKLFEIFISSLELGHLRVFEISRIFERRKKIKKTAYSLENMCLNLHFLWNDNEQNWQGIPEYLNYICGFGKAVVEKPP